MEIRFGISATNFGSKNVSHKSRAKDGSIHSQDNFSSSLGFSILAHRRDQKKSRGDRWLQAIPGCRGSPSTQPCTCGNASGFQSFISSVFEAQINCSCSPANLSTSFAGQAKQFQKPQTVHPKRLSTRSKVGYMSKRLSRYGGQVTAKPMSLENSLRNSHGGQKSRLLGAKIVKL